MVFVRPPGIESGGFELRPDNVWYCKLLLIFSLESQTDSGMMALASDVEYAKYVYYVIYVLYARYVKYACFTYLTYFAYLQSGWITLDPSWSMSARRTSKSCM